MLPLHIQKKRSHSDIPSIKMSTTSWKIVDLSSVGTAAIDFRHVKAESRIMHAFSTVTVPDQDLFYNLVNINHSLLPAVTPSVLIFYLRIGKGLWQYSVGKKADLLLCSRAWSKDAWIQMKGWQGMKFNKSPKDSDGELRHRHQHITICQGECEYTLLSERECDTKVHTILH